jgi:hypothetical protein
MFNEEILTEKLKYLITVEAKKFEIKSFSLSFSYDSWTNPTAIEEYDVDIEFEYNGTIEPDSDFIGRDIKNMCLELGEIIGTYGIDGNGKLTARGEHLVFPAMIWNINFSVDETHLFNVSYKVKPNG